MTLPRTILMLLVCFVGCKEEAAAPDAAPTASAPAPSVTPSTTPSASASAAPEVQHDCPAGSSGPGSFGKPCVAKGTARMLEITWAGKSNSAGAPTFKVTSKATKNILYGRVAVYFYDKAGKLIDVKDQVEGSDKTHAYHVCSGNLFAGITPNEKASYNFSCVTKSNVPDGMATMEAEAIMVGFADDSGKKNDFYWKNPDLAPEDRPKGGIKAQ